MSAEPIFDELHADLFAQYGRPAKVLRGAGPAVDITVVVDRGVSQTDDMGRVVRLVDVTSFLVAEWDPLQGDTVTLLDPVTLVETSWAKRVDTLESNDGFVCRAVMHG